MTNYAIVSPEAERSRFARAHAEAPRPFEGAAGERTVAADVARWREELTGAHQAQPLPAERGRAA